MSNSFSERQKIIEVKSLDLQDMPIEVKNRLWNIIQDYIDNKYHEGHDRNLIIESIWDKFFKQNKNDLWGQTSYR
jgi:hypothetical protein